jgi:hypothetical protein
MNNPLAYFEDLFSSDKSELKKRQMISDYLEFKSGDIINIDQQEGIIVENRYFYDEISKDWIQDIGTLKFENVFNDEFKKEIKIFKEYLLNKILDISSTGISTETFLNQIYSKIQTYLQKTSSYYTLYPFIRFELERLLAYILEQMPKKENLTKVKENSISRKAMRLPHNSHNESNYFHQDSFNWDSINEDDKISQIKNLYQLLTKLPAIISADESDFINAFTQKNVQAGITWLLEGKSRKTNVASICYLINKLQEEGFIDDFSSTDFGKKIKYVFRDKEGLEFVPNNLKSSISDFRKTYLCDYSERIDDIISEI